MPGLIRGVARTAVVAGTASAVSGRVHHRQQGRWAEQEAQAAYSQPTYAQPAPTYTPQPVYAVPVEAVDVLDYMTVTGTAGASIIGTSRGGLIAMVMAAMQPRSVGPVVLNDIGPVIDQTGLGRISAYVGRIPLPSSWKEAGALVHAMGLSDAPQRVPRVHAVLNGRRQRRVGGGAAPA